MKKEIINHEKFETHENIVGAGPRRAAGGTMASIDLPNAPDEKVFQNGDKYQICVVGQSILNRVLLDE